MYKSIDLITGFTEEEKKDFEKFISSLFNVDFNFEKDQYRAQEGHMVYKCLEAYPHFIKIGNNDFYSINNIILNRQFPVDERDYDTLLLLPLSNMKINNIDENNKILYITERTSEDINQEWDKAINLTLEWTLFKGAKHPERIEEYKKNIQNKMISLRREERKLQERIDVENKKLIMLSDLQNNLVSNEEEKTL